MKVSLFLQDRQHRCSFVSCSREICIARTGHPRQKRGCTRSRRQRIGGRCPLGPILQGVGQSREHSSLKGRPGSYGLGDGLGVDESVAEFLPVLAVACVLDDNLLKVVRQLEDDVLVLLAELEVVPGGDTLLVDGCSALLLVSGFLLAVEPCRCLDPIARRMGRKGQPGRQLCDKGGGGETNPDCD